MLDFDFVEWDDETDPRGSVVHIEAAGLTPAEVEDVLYSPDPDADTTDETGRPCVFGRTSTGKYIIVVYILTTEGGVTVLYPITAFEVPEP
jgi:hypothetical protein